MFTLKGSEAKLIVSKSRQTNAFLAGKNYIEWCFVDPKRGEGNTVTPPDYQEAAAWENDSHVPVSSAQKLYAVFGDHLFTDLQIASDDGNTSLPVNAARPSNLISSSFSQTAGCHFERYNESLPGLRAFAACAVEASLHDQTWDNALVSISYLHQDQSDGRRVVRWLPFHGDGFPRNDKTETNAALDTLDFTGLNELLKANPITVKTNQGSDVFTFADAFNRNQKLLLNAVETAGGFIQVSRGEWIAFTLYWLILRACLWNESFRQYLTQFVKEGTQENLGLLLDEPIELPFSSLFASQSSNGTEGQSEEQPALLVFRKKSFREILQIGLRLHCSDKLETVQETSNQEIAATDISANLLEAIDFLNLQFGTDKATGLHTLSSLPMYRDLGWAYHEGGSPLADAIVAVSRGIVASLAEEGTTASFIIASLNERLEACYTQSVVPVLPLLYQWVCDLNLKQYITMPITEAQLDPGGVPVAVAWAHIMTPLDTEQARLKAPQWAKALSTASAALAGVISSDQAASREVEDDTSHTLKSKAESIKRLSVNLSKLLKPDPLKGLNVEDAIISTAQNLVKESERMSNLVEAAHLLKGSSMDSIDRVLSDNNYRSYLFTEGISNLSESIRSLVDELNQGRTGTEKEISVLSIPDMSLTPCIASQGKSFHFSQTLIELYLFEVLNNARNKAVGEIAKVEIDFEDQSNRLVWRNRADSLRHTEWQKPPRKSSGLGSFDQLLKRFEVGRIETRFTEEQDAQGENAIYFELRMTMKGLSIPT